MSAVWFNLGIRYKHLHCWQDCVEANLRALELEQSREDPAWWNLGIAATALHDWPLARSAWRGYGLKIDGEEGPVSCDYGSAPVRLPHGEVVWGDRLDPTRVIIRNVPLPDGAYRYGEIVLHDGAPNGNRRVNGRDYGVLDVFESWCPSEIPTYRVSVTCPDNESSDFLEVAFFDEGFGAEDWTASVRNLCHACSTGDPDANHRHEFGTSDRDRIFGIAAPEDLARRLLGAWKLAGAARDYGSLEAV